MGKSESEIKMNDINDRLADLASDINTILYAIKSITALEKRVIRMERAFDALGRRLEGSERHVEDEGWFD